MAAPDTDTGTQTMDVVEVMRSTVIKQESDHEERRWCNALAVMDAAIVSSPHDRPSIDVGTAVRRGSLQTGSYRQGSICDRLRSTPRLERSRNLGWQSQRIP